MSRLLFGPGWSARRGRLGPRFPGIEPIVPVRCFTGVDEVGVAVGAADGGDDRGDRGQWDHCEGEDRPEDAVLQAVEALVLEQLRIRSEGVPGVDVRPQAEAAADSGAA